MTVLSLLRYREKGYNVPQIPLDSLHTKILTLTLCTFYHGAYLLNLKSPVGQSSNTEKLTPNTKLHFVAVLYNTHIYSSGSCFSRSGLFQLTFFRVSYSMLLSVLRTVHTIVIAHMFCASSDTRISYRQCLLIQGYFCAA